MKHSYYRVFCALVFSCTIVLAPQVYSQTPASLDLPGDKKIVVVGDSLSAAYKLPREQGWVYLLKNKLQEAKSSYQVVNASVSGATTAAGLAMMKKTLDTHQPNIVILELGANDGLQGKPVAYITKNLDRLITLAKQSGARVLLVGIRLPPNFGSRYTEPFYRQYADLAQKHELNLVPFLLEGVAGNQALMMSDGLHPKSEGQPIMLDNVWPVLKDML